MTSGIGFSPLTSYDGRTAGDNSFLYGSEHVVEGALEDAFDVARAHVASARGHVLVGGCGE